MQIAFLSRQVPIPKKSEGEQSPYPEQVHSTVIFKKIPQKIKNKKTTSERNSLQDFSTKPFRISKRWLFLFH